jgi:hypothetical protein
MLSYKNGKYPTEFTLRSTSCVEPNRRLFYLQSGLSDLMTRTV